MKPTADGEGTRADCTSISHGAAAYLDSLAQSGRSTHTLASTRGDLAQLARFLGLQPVNAVGASDLRAFFRWLERQRGNKSSSLRRKTSSVKGFFAYLYATGQVRIDPSATIPYPTLEIPRTKPLSRVEADAVFSASPPGAWRVLVALLLDCGLKRDELVALRWDDLEGLPSGQFGRLHVRRRHASQRVRRRVLALTPRLHEALVMHQSHEGMLEGAVVGISPRGIDFVVETIARRARVRLEEKVTPRMLRDAFALRRVLELRRAELFLKVGSAERDRLEAQHDVVLLRELGLSDRGDAVRRYRRLLEENEPDWAE
jgi:site-specific recombinase XerD